MEAGLTQSAARHMDREAKHRFSPASTDAAQSEDLKGKSSTGVPTSPQLMLCPTSSHSTHATIHMKKHTAIGWKELPQ